MSSDDYGRDLTGVQNLRRKHRRLDTELASHEPQVELVRSKGLELIRTSDVGGPEIQRRMADLEKNWGQIRSLTGNRCRDLKFIFFRHKKLNESEDFQTFLGKIEEEEAWMNEKQQILSSDNLGENMAAVQGLLKKHDTFQVDLQLHTQRINDLIKNGQDLINAGNHHAPNIATRIEQLKQRLADIESLAKIRLQKLKDNSAYLQFMWKCDVVESWIGESKYFY